MEKYSRGRRGAPAKGVGRATGARVQIPLSPLRLGSDTGPFVLPVVTGCAYKDILILLECYLRGFV